MSIRRILVPLPEGTNHTTEIETALLAAKALRAHVDAFYIERPGASADTMPMVSVGGRPTGIDTQALQKSADQRERQVEAARGMLERACREHGVVMVEPGEHADMASATWSRKTGSNRDVVLAHAAAYDLVVASSAAVVEPLREVAEASLLASRRPVLLAPSRINGDASGTALIAWENSVECWHSVSAALPFLEQAKRVRIVNVAKRDNGGNGHEEVLNYLRWHGIEAAFETIRPLSDSIADVLLSEAGECHADLMVMGAYSHSPLRERLLGGTTRHVLSNAAATPVLMMH